MRTWSMFIIIVFLFPFVLGAQISGYVVDDQDNLIRHAVLKVICDPPTVVPQQTDEVGFFSFEATGRCQVLAIYDGRMALEEVDVNESRSYLMQLRIPPPAERELGSFLLYLVLGAALAGLGWIIVRHKRSLRSTESSILLDESNIMKTLTANERLLVEQVQIRGPLTQSQLRHYTGFPKSSLHRVLTKLEQRSILVCKEDAGIKKVYLTDILK